MLRPLTAALAVTTVVALAGCGDDGDDSNRTQNASSAGNVERYCALTRELDAAGTKFFAELERDNASPADFEAAERRFIEANAAKIAEVERSAPAEVRADIRTLLDSQRERAGLEPRAPVDEAGVSAAEERVQAYEKRACQAR